MIIKHYLTLSYFVLELQISFAIPVGIFVVGNAFGISYLMNLPGAGLVYVAVDTERIEGRILQAVILVVVVLAPFVLELLAYVAILSKLYLKSKKKSTHIKPSGSLLTSHATGHATPAQLHHNNSTQYRQLTRSIRLLLGIYGLNLICAGPQLLCYFTGLNNVLGENAPAVAVVVDLLQYCMPVCTPLVLARCSREMRDAYKRLWRSGCHMCGCCKNASSLDAVQQ